MLLDVILKEPDLVWLATSEEKMTHVSAFTAIPKDSLPQMTTPQGSYEPVRYFPDQAPIGLHPDGRWILVCLLTQDARRELRSFLEQHLMFLAELAELFSNAALVRELRKAPTSEALFKALAGAAAQNAAA